MARLAIPVGPDDHMRGNPNARVANAEMVRALRVVDGIQPNFVWNQVSTGCTGPFTVNFTNQTAGPGNLTYSWNLSGATPEASSDTSPAMDGEPVMRRSLAARPCWSHSCCTMRTAST